MADTKIGNQKSPRQELLVEEPRAAAVRTPEEIEEELQDREAALAAREDRLAKLEAKMTKAMDRLDRANAGAPSEDDLADAPKIEYDAKGVELPRFDSAQPYGVVYGDSSAGYVQNGHRFSTDKKYLCEEPRGTGKPFNIRLLGVVKAKAA